MKRTLLLYVADKDSFGPIEAENEIYYTFADLSVDVLADGGTNPQTQWVKLDKITQSISINKNQTVKLVTSKMVSFPDVSMVLSRHNADKSGCKPRLVYMATKLMLLFLVPQQEQKYFIL